MPSSHKTPPGKPSQLKRRLDGYEKLMRLDKPIGIFLLLWPTLWGLWYAGDGLPKLTLLWAFIVGVIIMRSAGCVINDILDQKFDGHVERTKNRPLVTKEVSEKEAWALFFVLCICGFLLIIKLSYDVWLWAAAALFMLATYPLAKRFFPFPQAYLGIAFGFGIPMAYTALYGYVITPIYILMLANAFWTLAYDTIYAMVDRDDDLKLGLKSSAITLGKYDVTAVLACYEICLILLAYFGQQNAYSVFYFIPILIAQLLVFEYYRLIRRRDRMHCFRAFRKNNWFGLIVFIAFVAEYNGRILLDLAPTPRILLNTVVF